MEQRFSFKDPLPGRWGLYGGTFDPIHGGHLYAACRVMEALCLDGVIFMPSGDPPHKTASLLTAGEDRLAMVRLAIAGDRRFYYTDYELTGPGPHYSYRTCEALAAQLPPQTELVFIVGGDSLERMHTWRHPDRILRAMPVAAAYRPGVPMERMAAARERLGPDRITLVPCDGLDISSTAIREGALTQVSPPVKEYICKRRLYGYGPRGAD